jgi:hypothetical protein
MKDKNALIVDILGSAPTGQLALVMEASKAGVSSEMCRSSSAVQSLVPF